MIHLQTFFAFIERNYSFLLVLDEDERIVHASDTLCRAGSDGWYEHAGRALAEIVSPDSLAEFRSALHRAEDDRTVVIYQALAPRHCSIPLQSLRIISAGEPPQGGRRLSLFFGHQLDGLSGIEDWQQTERIKELSCLYSTAEWIEASSSVREFFGRLPEYLSRGMRYPEAAIVWASYQGVEYGQKPRNDDCIAAKLHVFGQDSGEIRVGYLEEAREVLPEEQKMLSEIARVLNLALERKELGERVATARQDQATVTRKMAELQAEAERRTRELEDQRRKLDTINGDLDRVNRSWTESRNRLDTIFQAIPDEVALIDRSRIVRMTNKVNEAESATGRKCHQVFFNSDVPCKDCRLARIIREKTPITLTIKQDERYLEVHALPVFNEDHEVDGIMEFYRDATLEKTYEQQLRQADKLASLGQLVSGIGHEINNPNQFIRGNVKILKQAVEDMLPVLDDWFVTHPELKIARLPYPFFRKHVLTLVDDMAHGSDRIKGIVEGLKKFARHDDGLLIDTVDVNTIIHDTTRLVHNEVHKTSDIVLELEPGLPSLAANAQKLEQILVNLIVNAAQAIPDDHRGTVTVRTRQDGNNIVIEVADNGRGMNESTLKQIFDPFFTTKRAKGGTGLGLAIAYRIVEEHSGTISVSSTPGVGTTFVIRFPIRTSLQSVTINQKLGN
jgi:signal transduction histidine kinase